MSANLNAAEVLQGVVSTPAALEAVLNQGAMIVNDYVFTVEETETVYIFTARKGSEVQTIRIPKGGEDGSGVYFTTDETLTLDPDTKVLSVNTASEVEKDNTLPITSAAVHSTVGNIEILLGTI